MTSSNADQTEPELDIAGSDEGDKTVPSLQFTGWNGERVPGDEIQRLSVIRKGPLGKVWRVQRPGSDKIFAMKVIDRDATADLMPFPSSKRPLLTAVHHPFFLKVYSGAETDGHRYFIMDYLAGGDLSFHLANEGSFAESRVRFYAAELIVALETLHLLHRVHCGLRLDAVLLDSAGHIGITDFGVHNIIFLEAYCVDLSPNKTYLAPEVIFGQPYSSSADWWSLGMMIHEMLVGLLPFHSPDGVFSLSELCSGTLTLHSDIPPDVQSLLTGLLTRDPDLRLGANSFRDGAADIKAHPWFAGINWEKISTKQIEPPFKPC